MLRYTLSIIDLRRARTRGGESAPPWENKSMYIFYIELLTGAPPSCDLLFRSLILARACTKISLSWRPT